MKFTLERMTNVATIIACLFVVGHLSTNYYREYSGRPSAPYSAGDSIADTTELGLRTTSVTLLIGTVSTCRYCTESMEYYGRLTKLARERGVRVVAVTGEPLETNRQYLASHGIRPDNVVSAIPNKVIMSGTPTLILVREDGTVVKAWLGKLTSDGEMDILRLVAAS